MLLEVLALVAALAAFYYWRHVSKYNYWTKKGVRQLAPKFPYGNYAELLARQPGKREQGVRLYQDFKDVPWYGGYFMSSPVLVVRDVEAVKDIMVKKFDHFTDRTNSNYFKE